VPPLREAKIKECVEQKKGDNKTISPASAGWWYWQVHPLLVIGVGSFNHLSSHSRIHVI
jgi:hypothetical protein